MEKAIHSIQQESLTTNDFSIEVTLKGKELDPSIVSKIVGLEPTALAERGAPRRPSVEDGKRWEFGFWSREIHSSDEVNECRDHHISCLIAEIEPHVEALKRIGMESVHFYYTLASSIGLLNIKLAPSTMKRLSDIGAELYISCYDCFDPKDPFWKEDCK